MTKNDAEKLTKIEKNLRHIPQTPIVSKRYTVDDIDFSDFHEWARASRELRDPDRARNALYFGFQPLYDSLVDESVPDSQRGTTVNVLNKLIATGVEFLTGYYTGKPDTRIFTDGIRGIQDGIASLDGLPYRTKFRNVDFNGIYPKDILSFLKQYLEHALGKESFVPGYVVGCACGSSEVVMPLAGLLGTDLGFIRRSYRRGDDAPRIVKEHEPVIKERCRGEKVVCVEDYVCTGRSLGKVMEKVASFGASSLEGASVNGDSPSYINIVTSGKKFYIHRLS